VDRFTIDGKTSEPSHQGPVNVSETASAPLEPKRIYQYVIREVISSAFNVAQIKTSRPVSFIKYR